MQPSGAGCSQVSGTAQSAARRTGQRLAHMWRCASSSSRWRQTMTMIKANRMAAVDRGEQCTVASNQSNHAAQVPLPPRSGPQTKSCGPGYSCPPGAQPPDHQRPPSACCGRAGSDVTSSSRALSARCGRLSSRERSPPPRLPKFSAVLREVRWCQTSRNEAAVGGPERVPSSSRLGAAVVVSKCSKRQ